MAVRGIRTLYWLQIEHTSKDQWFGSLVVLICVLCRDGSDVVQQLSDSRHIWPKSGLILGLSYSSGSGCAAKLWAKSHEPGWT